MKLTQKDVKTLKLPPGKTDKIFFDKSSGAGLWTAYSSRRIRELGFSNTCLVAAAQSSACRLARRN